MAKILIIDDEKQVQRYLQKLLEKQGFEVYTAQDGEKGLRLFQENDIDLVITDIVMPEKEGIETINDLKAISPDVKIIAISGGSLQIHPENCLMLAKVLGADYTIQKPFENDTFLEVVRQALGGK